MVHNGRVMDFGRYLRRRGARWFFRFRWPKRIAGCGLSGELVLTLQTSDYALALRRARWLRLQVEHVTAQFTPAMSRNEMDDLVRAWIDAMALTFSSEASTLDLPMPVIKAATVAQEVASDHSTAGGQPLAHTILRGYTNVLQKLQETIASIPKFVATAAPNQNLPGFPFLIHWEDFERWKLNERQWKQDMAANARASRNLFAGFFPGVGITAVIEGSLGADFRANILKLPRYYDKDRRWRRLAVSAAHRHR